MVIGEVVVAASQASTVAAPGGMGGLEGTPGQPSAAANGLTVTFVVLLGVKLAGKVTPLRTRLGT